MKQLIIFITLIMLLTVAKTKSAEIIPVWQTESGAGDIQDIELLPGGNELMLTTAGGEIQIRDVLSGDTIRTYRDISNLFMNGYFEFTPDSTRFVMANSGLLQLVQLDNFERIKYFAFGSDTIAKGFKSLVLDPIKPLAYVIVTGWEKNSGNNDMRSKVSVYNYETMELVKDLTDYEGYEFSSIAVSDDGKYLATLNNGKAYLKVWDLATMELIRDVQLYDDKLPNTDWWCDSKDIQFSKINSDVVYYSGYFTKQIDEKRQNGVFNFSISSNLKSRIVEDGLYDGGGIVVLDNEKRILTSTPNRIYVLNLEMNVLEYKFLLKGTIHASEKVIHLTKDNSFIGFSNYFLDKFLYDRESNIGTEYEEEIIISPNPTNNFVNIELNCIEQLINYQINDVNGLLVYNSSVQNHVGRLQVDFSSYPIGIYFLTLNCNNTTKTYKLVKEG
ncbi:MAG: T9SS type A sorting domain-containing protein [Candidatus Kapaibacterium sp.]|nr:T9SS type A sorting domain-containing protein [Ignavibacteriota bacterium]